MSVLTVLKKLHLTQIPRSTERCPEPLWIVSCQKLLHPCAEWRVQHEANINRKNTRSSFPNGNGWSIYSILNFFSLAMPHLGFLQGQTENWHWKHDQHMLCIHEVVLTAWKILQSCFPSSLFHLIRSCMYCLKRLWRMDLLLSYQCI